MATDRIGRLLGFALQCALLDQGVERAPCLLGFIAGAAFLGFRLQRLRQPSARRRCALCVEPMLLLRRAQSFGVVIRA